MRKIVERVEGKTLYQIARETGIPERMIFRRYYAGITDYMELTRIDNIVSDRRVYISGGITNNPTYKEDFERAKKHLSSIGYRNIVNPAQINEVFSGMKLSHEEYMKICIPEMLLCDDVYFINGWHLSKGAIQEHKIAKDKGLNLMFEER